LTQEDARPVMRWKFTTTVSINVFQGKKFTFRPIKTT